MNNKKKEIKIVWNDSLKICRYCKEVMKTNLSRSDRPANDAVLLCNCKKSIQYGKMVTPDFACDQYKI